jgi:gliding motility-associated-like protein
MKSAQLTLTDGVTETTIKNNIILINPVPEVIVEDVFRCGGGELSFTAKPKNGNWVDFSFNSGNSIAGSDNSEPYQFSSTINEGETIKLWVRATNKNTTCVGRWVQSGTGTAVVKPVTPAIQVVSSNAALGKYLDAVCYDETKTYFVNSVPGSTYRWNIPSINIQQTTTYEIVADWKLSDGVYAISVVQITPEGCEGTLVTDSVLVSIPTVELGSDVILCGNATHTFILNHDFEKYKWNNFSSQATYLATNTEKVWVEVTNTIGCKASDTVLVYKYGNPIVNLGRDTILCGNSVLEINPGKFDSYVWSNGDAQSSIIVHPGDGNLSVTVTDVHGCKGSSEIKILECSADELFSNITNAFTPNNDDVHDTWVINNIELYPNASIEVFDRWGRLVFSVDGNYQNDWDGTSNGKKLPMDTYFYVINFKTENIKTRKGTVTIVR